MPSTQVAFFRIFGKDMTTTARDMLLSERPAAAWRLLSEGLMGGEPGETDVIAREILDGTKKLTGDSSKGIRVVADRSSAAYKRDLKFVYAGRIRINGKWMRPFGEVTLFGPEDAEFANEGLPIPTVDSDRFAGWKRRRVEYYVGSNQRLVCVDGRYIIFEMTSEPPFWWKEHITPRQALDEFLAVGRSLIEIEHPHEEGEETDEEAEKRRREEAAREYDKQAAAAEKRYNAEIERIREGVIKQAGDDVFQLHVSDGRVLTVPRAPFWHWALGRTSLRHLAPPWEPVANSGMKLPMDNEFHTDWMVGAGVDLDESYNSEVSKAAMNAVGEIQEQLGDFEAAVIVEGRGSEITGVVGEGIVVLPDLSADHALAAMKAQAIITEEGGQLAHLAIVALERGLTIMRVPDAVTRYPEGTKVTLKPSTGQIVTHWNYGRI
jgi:phosphohistidine swiveling domain-containing protein